MKKIFILFILFDLMLISACGNNTQTTTLQTTTTTTKEITTTTTTTQQATTQQKTTTTTTKEITTTKNESKIKQEILITFYEFLPDYFEIDMGDKKRAYFFDVFFIEGTRIDFEILEGSNDIRVFKSDFKKEPNKVLYSGLIDLTKTETQTIKFRLEVSYKNEILADREIECKIKIPVIIHYDKVTISEAKNRLNQISAVEGTINYVGPIIDGYFNAFLIDKYGSGLKLYKVPEFMKDTVYLHTYIEVGGIMSLYNGQYELRVKMSGTLGGEKEPYIHEEIDITEKIYNFDSINELQNIPVYLTGNWKINEGFNDDSILLSDDSGYVFSIYINYSYTVKSNDYLYLLRNNIGNNLTKVNGYLSVFNGLPQIILTDYSSIEIK
jgi:hypothetical protein